MHRFGFDPAALHLLTLSQRLDAEVNPSLKQPEDRRCEQKQQQQKKTITAVL